MNLAREGALGTSHAAICAPHFAPRTVRVDADAGGVEQRDLAVEGDGDRSKQPVPHPGFASADEPVVAARRGAVSLGYLRPRRASPEMPKNAVQHPRPLTRGTPHGLFGSSG